MPGGIYKPSCSPARGSRLEEGLKDWTVGKGSILQHSEPPAGHPDQPAQRAGLQTVSGLEGLREAKATARLAGTQGRVRRGKPAEIIPQSCLRCLILALG